MVIEQLPEIKDDIHGHNLLCMGDVSTKNSVWVVQKTNDSSYGRLRNETDMFGIQLKVFQLKLAFPKKGDQGVCV